ncbi:hypothetical protein [Sneathiella glossodoripedis]|uniref:hypothetical protein n=1 Tax=Sneathiella glossodoripedis TaxID=418853 RepID=UPI00046E8645|nr:hypothetical protein [Sneathiella glossodoripedis]
MQLPISFPKLALGVSASIVLVALSQASTAQAAPQVVELVQVPCQFLGVESDHGFTSTQKSDCETINANTADDRLKDVAPMKLAAGEYVFRVTNKNVPYELGFWIREKGYNWANPLHKLNKLSVSGGGMHEGKTIEYKVTLKPGEYVFSCPLNSTPDYALVVE